MTIDLPSLSNDERETFETTVRFMSGRVQEVEIVEWALGLPPIDRGARAGVVHAVQKARKDGLKEPWARAWELIEEAWLTTESPHSDGVNAALVKLRLEAGDRSGVVIEAINALVAPRLLVKRTDPRSRKTRPKTYQDLIWPTLTSGTLVKPRDLGLGKVHDVQFLASVANALEASMRYGMDAARRIGWDGGDELWALGLLYRIDCSDEDDDADRHHTGIAPVAKLLYAVIRRLTEINHEAAYPFVQAWGLHRSIIDVRLWAAAAKDPALVSSGEVGQFLFGLNDQRFWEIEEHPEVAALRASRFAHLDTQTQVAITLRLRKGPPRNLWPQGVDAKRVKEAREFCAARELRRIEVSGGALPRAGTDWLPSRLGRFKEELAEMRPDGGFLGAPRAAWIPESAVGTPWTADHSRPHPERRLHEEGSVQDILNDLTGDGVQPDQLPDLWNRFARKHEPTEDVERNRREAETVLALVRGLSVDTVQKAIRGLTEWLMTWADVVVHVNGWHEAWLTVWPEAIAATNARYKDGDEGNLGVVVSGGDPDSPMDLDAFNTEAGHLVGVFLQACPNRTKDLHNPFKQDAALRRVRDALLDSRGQSLLIARHRLIAALPYFVRADREWAKTNLIDQLMADNPATPALWRAASSGILRHNVLELIGHHVVSRVTDQRLDRDTRSRLLRSLVGESLSAYLADRTPAVEHAWLQQALRLVNDDMRSSAARVVVDFIKQVGSSQDHTPSEVFLASATPFLLEVWPRDRSLVTPGVASAFAELPATAGDAFVAATDTVKSRLIPFGCHALMDFGLGTPRKLKLVDDPSKAQALLQVLDACVGAGEDAVVPYDLSDALARVESVDHRLTASKLYRRLAAAARR